MSKRLELSTVTLAGDGIVVCSHDRDDKHIFSITDAKGVRVDLKGVSTTELRRITLHIRDLIETERQISKRNLGSLLADETA